METNSESLVPEFEKFFEKIYKFRFLIPVFPSYTQETAKFWYKESLTAVFAFSSFFYLISIFFIYLAISDKNHLTDFLMVALAWLITGVIVPSVIYRLTIFILKKQHLVE